MMSRFISRQEILKTFGMLFKSTEKEGVFDKNDIYPFHIASFEAEFQNRRKHRFSSRSQVTWTKCKWKAVANTNN